MRKVAIAAAVAALAWASVPGAAEAPPVPAELVAVVKALKPQHGKIAIPAAKATLDLGETYDFYGAADAATILTQVWGNPPELAQGVLGLVMPAGKSPLTDAWGAVVTYEDTGFVSDSDADETDYNALLEQMRSGEAERNAERKSGGYAATHLVGWAEPPHYDKTAHSIVWARDIQFEGSDADTLNYDVRTLGRSGVLSLNLVSVMPNLPEVKLAAADFARHASFDSGARYADYDSSSDRTAEFGVGGLVAAGVGVAVAKKLGILALLLKFIKPILIGLVVAFGAFRGKIAALFRRKEDPLEG